MKLLLPILQLLLISIVTKGTPANQTPFSSQLLQVIVKDKSSENVIFSPISIKSCLALAYIGSSGSTADELKNTLQLTGETKAAVAENFNRILKKQKTDEATLAISNRFYVNKKFQIAAKFNEIAVKHFEAAAENVEFSKSEQTAKQINAWVEQQTENKIKNLLSATSLDENTAAVLVNAIYFKANWTNPFESYATNKQNFALNEGEHVEVDMMSQWEYFLYGDLPELQATALELPYEGSDLAMLVILPKAVDGLTALEANLISIDLTKVSAEFKKEKINLKLPKFKLEFEISLKPILEQVGIKSMFTPEADFSNLLSSKEQQISVSEVKHKAFIEVNEMGTEAAAATSIKFGLESLIVNERTYDFVVDHPFFFAIKDKENIYFAGHVVKF